jgi:hypothetical protein
MPACLVITASGRCSGPANFAECRREIEEDVSRVLEELEAAKKKVTLLHGTRSFACCTSS